jgi:hypothetical protein
MSDKKLTVTLQPFDGTVSMSEKPVSGLTVSTTAKRSESPPTTIYLQWHGGEPEAGSVDHADVTWCADRMNDSDVEYVLAEEVACYRQMNERLIAQLERQAAEIEQLKAAQPWKKPRTEEVGGKIYLFPD